MVRWSVLLPTHNRPSTLSLSIRTVLDQSDGDLELLVVGDGCTDNTAEVVRGFGDPRVRWFDLPKAEGFGYANRRTALEDAGGRYLALASHDDLWSPDHLTELGTLLDAGHSLAYSRPIWATPSGHLVSLPFDLGDETMKRRFAIDNYIPATFIAMPLNEVEAAGGWPVDVASAADWTLMRRLLARPGATAGYTAAATALHFRSIDRSWDNDLVAVILDEPDLDDWWPAAALVPANGGELQAAVAGRAAADIGWWSALGAAAMRVDAHLAMIAAGALLQSKRLALEIEKLEAAHAVTVAAYLESRSWRLTAPLRWLSERGPAKRG